MSSTHSMAAGLTIKRANIKQFAERLRALAVERLTDIPDQRTMTIDLDLDLADVTLDLFTMLQHLMPFGAGNPAPVLVARGVRLENVSVVGEDGAHLRALLRGDTASLQAIGFRMGGRQGELNDGCVYDAAFHLWVDSWNGRQRLQAHLIDYRPTDTR